MTDNPEHRYWYNMKTGEVEYGLQSRSIDRVGPFDTREEAENALATLRENSERWEREEREEEGR